MVNAPASVHLGSHIPATLAKVLDDAGNFYHSDAIPQRCYSTPKVLSFSCSKLHVAPANGQSARWHSPGASVHQLQLPALDISPIAGQLTMPSSQSLTGVECAIDVVLSGLSDGQGHLCQVSTTFTIAVLPGTFCIAAWISILCNRSYPLAVLSPPTFAVLAVHFFDGMAGRTPCCFCISVPGNVSSR